MQTKALTEAAKEDSSAMRALTKATKLDSSAMKTIAVMTMLFLPGTFFAALFSMPVFKWDDGKSTVTQDLVNRKFWVYWIFTLPVTALVFGTWKIWTNRMERRLDAEDRRWKGETEFEWSEQ